ncbi:MAG: NADH-quinone oxidoreductase subunit J [Planctomycetes bacterium]|nr:NADH-quinone oxidoreductase subunit J [Planctomycetota bacterium]
MAATLLVLLLTLGGLGLFLAMPGGHLNRRGAAIVVLAAAAAALLLLILRLVAGAAEGTWVAAFALVSLWGAVRVVTHPRPVYSALYFILVVVAVAGMLVLIQAKLLAAALVIIYAGAILVTYVFVIMLAQQHGPTPCDSEAREPFFGCIAGFVLLIVIVARLFSPGGDGRAPQPAEAATASAGTVQAVGTHLLTHYAVGVELAGVLLLAAMVGAIAIARRRVRPLLEGEEG